MTTPESLITRVDFLTVPTRSIEGAMAFYGTVLGLPCSVVYGNIPGAEFETGNLTLAVIEPEAIGLEFRPNANTIALHVDDVAAARAELESRGVAFTGDILDTGVCHMAFFADPDGNALMLHHNYAREAARH
jgi:predicted enzyme related to lactoylglutathione lyase